MMLLAASAGRTSANLFSSLFMFVFAALWGSIISRRVGVRAPATTG